MDLVELLRTRASDQPDATAFTWLADDPTRDTTLTYGDLDRRARSIGGMLRQAGPPGGRALLHLPPGFDFIAALFGCFYAGWVAVPAYPPSRSHQLDRLRLITADAQPRVALTADDLVLDAADDWRPPTIHDGSLAVLQYTSGSTAAPRGVMLTHANLLHNATQIARRFEAGPESRGVIWLPPYHDMGLVGGILEGVLAGFPIALMAPLSFLQRPRRWLEAVTRTRATISGGPNFAYDQCVSRISPDQRVGLDLSSWRVAFNGAEPVREQTLMRFTQAFSPYGFRADAFYPCYGLAEATLMVSGGSASAPPALGDQAQGVRLVGCGSSIDDQRVAIVDPATQLRSAAGEIGEVWVSGPSVGDGYWRQPELTRDVFQACLPDDPAPYLRTGDLGFVRPCDGELFITGRLKTLLIVGGRKIQAEDIERCVLDGPRSSVQPAAVVALSVEVDGQERLVVLHEAATRAAEESHHALTETIRQRIAETHQLPVWSVVVVRPGRIPRTSSGKVQRRTCRDLFLAQQLESVYQWRAPWVSP